MATGRIIRKSISYSEKMGKLKSADACLLYTWLLTHLDVNGNFYSNPHLIKGLVVAMRKEFTEENIKQYLIEFEELGLIKAYRPDDDTFVHYPDFVSKQIRLEKEKAKFPLFTKEKQVTLSKSVGNTSEVRRKPVSNVIELNITESNLCDKSEKPLTAKEPPSKFHAFKYFFDQYLENRKTKYIATDDKKEAGIITNLCKKVGEEEFKRALANMFATKDAFILKQGLTVYTLNGKINLWLERPLPAADPNADNRYFVERGGKYYVMNNETDNFTYTKEYWLERIAEFEKMNKKKADVRHE